MNRKMVVTGFLVLVVSLFVVGRFLSQDGQPYSTDIGALRARFNADRGTVRLLLLLSPT